MIVSKLPMSSLNQTSQVFLLQPNSGYRDHSKPICHTGAVVVLMFLVFLVKKMPDTGNRYTNEC